MGYGSDHYASQKETVESDIKYFLEEHPLSELFEIISYVVEDYKKE